MIKNKKNTLIFIAIFAVIGTFFILKDRNKKDSRLINVMIMVIDALRPDHLGCYGYERNTSPNIDRLAKQGILFSQAISAGGWTFESVPSILTSTYSFTHQIRGPNNFRNPQIKTIAGELNTKGYHCVLWSNHSTLKYLDIKEGFQKVYIPYLYKDNNRVLSDYILTSQIINRLKKRYKNIPFFFYIHYEGCHVPYRPPPTYKHIYLHDNKYGRKSEFIPVSNRSDGDEKYGGQGKIPYVVAENNITDPNYYISQYDGAISYTDEQIGRLTDALKELDLDKNTLIILTADHGEMLGEHDIYFTHNGAYEENIRVPLIIRFPKLCPRGKVISRQVSLVDIAPTILELVGLNRPSYMQGESLFAFIKPFRIYRAKYVLSCCKNTLALRAEDWKLIYANDFHEWELFNLRNDPKEQYNLIAKRPDKFKQLKQNLENRKKYNASLIPVKKGPLLEEKDKERLRSLGYVQ